MKRLRVAVVTDALYPWHKGGKEVRYLHLLSGLIEHEMDVVVYSMKWWDHTPEVVTTEFGTLTYRSICPRIPMYRGARRSIIQALVFAVSTFRLLPRKFDVIEADHMPYLQLVPLRVVAWVRRVPLVITWHEVWGKQGWRTYVGPLGSFAAVIERACIKFPDEIVAVSAGTADKLVAMGANRDHVHVVANPVDLDRLHAAVPHPSAPELLFVGRLIEHKQASLVIEAVRILVAKGNDVHLGLVGAGPEEDRLRELVESFGLTDRVTFYGAVETQSDVWSLVRGTRVLLAPSVREGFGLVVAEALAMGTPVVCAIHPENESTRLVGPTTGSLIPAFDAPALADAAQYWLNNDSQRIDRVTAFLNDHAEMTGGALAALYADILRSVTE